MDSSFLESYKIESGFLFTTASSTIIINFLSILLFFLLVVFSSPPKFYWSGFTESAIKLIQKHWIDSPLEISFPNQIYAISLKISQLCPFLFHQFKKRCYWKLQISVGSANNWLVGSKNHVAKPQKPQCTLLTQKETQFSLPSQLTFKKM